MHGHPEYGTFAARSELRAAVGVSEDAHGHYVVVLASPRREATQTRPQGDAAFRDDVLVSGRGVLIPALVKKTLRRAGLEAGGQDGARNAEVEEEVVVAPDAVEGVRRHQERPSLAHDLECSSDRALLVRVVLTQCHISAGANARALVQ